MIATLATRCAAELRRAIRDILFPSLVRGLLGRGKRTLGSRFATVPVAVAISAVAVIPTAVTAATAATAVTAATAATVVVVAAWGSHWQWLAWVKPALLALVSRLLKGSCFLSSAFAAAAAAATRRWLILFGLDLCLAKPLAIRELE